MSDIKIKISVDEILKDTEAKKQLIDLLLDKAEENCEMKLGGKSYKVSLDANFPPTH